jgi:ornithine--oxo-acid transaminase
VGREVVRLLGTEVYQQRAREFGDVLHARLGLLVGHGVIAVRGRGLWAGVDVEPSLATGREVCERLVAKGVLTKDTHGSTIRFAPPLVIERSDVVWAVDQLAAVLAELS